MLAQFSLGGELAYFSRCNRCHRPLSNPQSVIRGYGPVCWAKIASVAEEMRDSVMPTTITDAAEAAKSMQKLWHDTMSNLTRDKCWCGKRMENLEITSFDYGPGNSGYKLEGYGDRQWVFLHCQKCNYDWALWKIVKSGSVELEREDGNKGE